MIDPLLWLIYLLTYSDSERVLHGSRREFGVSAHWFGVNMGFSDEGGIFNGSIRFQKL